QVANAIVGGLRCPLAQNFDVATIRVEDAHDHPQRGGLARPIWSDKTIDRPRGHLQAQIRDSHVFAKGLGDVLKCDCIHGLSGWSSGTASVSSILTGI